MDPLNRELSIPLLFIYQNKSILVNNVNKWQNYINFLYKRTLEIKWNLNTYKICNCVNCPIDSGMDPLNWFSDNHLIYLTK